MNGYNQCMPRSVKSLSKFDSDRSNFKQIHKQVSGEFMVLLIDLSFRKLIQETKIVS